MDGLNTRPGNIMNGLIPRLEKINLILDIVEDKDKNIFMEYSTEELFMVDKYVARLENLVKEFKISKEKLSKLEQQNNKDKLIMKKLFPYYWLINEKVNGLENND